MMSDESASSEEEVTKCNKRGKKMISSNEDDEVLIIDTTDLDEDDNKRKHPSKGCNSDSDSDLTSSEDDSKKRYCAHYTLEEDMKMIQYLLKNHNYLRTGGNKIFKEMAEKVFVGRTTNGLKLRFFRKLLPNLGAEKYNLSEDEIRKLRKENVDYYEKTEDNERILIYQDKKDITYFSDKEDQTILNFVVKCVKDTLKTGQKISWKGQKIWKQAQKEKVLPYRSATAMRKRFLGVILRQLSKYDIPRGIKKMLSTINDSSNQDGNKQGESINKTKAMFSKKEDRKLIDFITTGKNYIFLDKLKIWRLAEEKNLCPGKSCLQMQNRMVRIVKNEIGYPKLTKKTIKKLTYVKSTTGKELSEKRTNFSRKNKDFFVKPDEHDKRCLWKCAPRSYVTNDDSENSESEDEISSEEDQPDQKHEMIIRRRSVSSSSSGNPGSKSSSGKKATKSEFTEVEDLRLMQFFIENIDSDGFTVWNLAEGKEICPGKSFWSMRERFLKFIIPNVESYDCDEKAKTIIKRAARDNYGRISEMRGNYIIEEDLAIISYVTQNDRFLLFDDLKLWKDAVKAEICPGRSALSMKDRFKKNILPNYDRYKLDKEQEKKIEFLATATAEEIESRRKNLEREEASRIMKVLMSDGDDGDDSDSDAFNGVKPVWRKTFYYSPSKRQKTVESPVKRFSKTSKFGRPNSSARKSKTGNHRDASPQPSCSKYLSPTRNTKIFHKRKPINDGPERGEESPPKKKTKKDDSPAKDTESDTSAKQKQSFKCTAADKSKDSTPPKRKIKFTKDSPQKTKDDFPLKNIKDKNPLLVEIDDQEEPSKRINNKSSGSSPDEQSRNLSRRSVVGNSPKKTNENAPETNDVNDEILIEVMDSENNEKTYKSPEKQDVRTKPQEVQAEEKEATPKKKLRKDYSPAIMTPERPKDQDVRTKSQEVQAEEKEATPKKKLKKDYSPAVMTPAKIAKMKFWNDVKPILRKLKNIKILERKLRRRAVPAAC